jgi:hypothetical protein
MGQPAGQPDRGTLSGIAMTERIAGDFPERSTTLLRGFGRVLDRAALVGGAVAVAVAIVIAVALLAVFPFPFLFGPLVAALIGAAVGLAVERLLLPRDFLRAYEAFSWLGRAEMDRFEARTGSKVPVHRPGMEQWLAENPPSPAMQAGRIELLGFLGRLDEARAELANMTVTGPELAFERASLAQYIGWLTDGDARIDELRASVADLSLDAHYRHAADVTIALADARERFMRADPAWTRPLQDVRPSLGGAPARVVLRDTFRPLAILYFVLALLVAALASLLAVLA